MKDWKITKTLPKLDLESKCQGDSKNQEEITSRTKNLQSQKYLSIGCLSDLCDAIKDANADSTETICQNMKTTRSCFTKLLLNIEREMDRRCYSYIFKTDKVCILFLANAQCF